jgi:ATP-dependent DNA helicase RecG
LNNTLLHQPPSQTLAFLPAPNAEALAETLIAFANAEGGTVILGAASGGEPAHILLEDEVGDALQAALRLCRPPVRTEWQQETVPGGTVVVLRVERGDRLHALADGRVFVRKGAENRALEGERERSALAGRTAGEFELEPVAGARRSDLDDSVIDAFIERRQKRSPRGDAALPKDRLLQQLGALTDDRTPTVSGLLLFGREPQLFMPQSRAIFVRFEDVTPRGPGGAFGHGRREEITGPLPRVLDRAYRVTLEEMDKRAVVKGLQRHEETEYPTSAVREALVNAVAHRDYRITGRSIEIRMYTDRLEVISPGGLPGPMTLDNLVEEHYSRNPRLVAGLYEWGYIEELGLGIDRMIEDMKSAGHPEPKFAATEHSFTVILRKVQDVRVAAQAKGIELNERQTKAMEHLQRNGSITNSEYRDLCPEVGAETLRLDLADLVTRGLLLKIGDKRGTRYILK